jgi:hypothetical protein
MKKGTHRHAFNDAGTCPLNQATIKEGRQHTPQENRNIVPADDMENRKK